MPWIARLLYMQNSEVIGLKQWNFMRRPIIHCERCVWLLLVCVCVLIFSNILCAFQVYQNSITSKRFFKKLINNQIQRNLLDFEVSLILKKFIYFMLFSPPSYSSPTTKSSYILWTFFLFIIYRFFNRWCKYYEKFKYSTIKRIKTKRKHRDNIQEIKDKKWMI